MKITRWQPPPTPEKPTRPIRHRWGRLIASVLAGVFMAVSMASATSPQATAAGFNPANDLQCLAMPWASDIYPRGFGMFDPGVWDGKVKDADMWDSKAGKPTGNYTMWEMFHVNGAQWSYTVFQPKEGMTDADRTKVAGSMAGNHWVPGDVMPADMADYVKDDSNRRCTMYNLTINGMANMTLEGTKVWTAISLTFRGMASKPVLLLGLLDAVSGPTNDLYTVLYLGFAAVMVMFGGMWVMSKGLGNKGAGSREGIKGAAWMVFALLVGVVLLTPSAVAGYDGKITPKPLVYSLTKGGLEVADNIGASLGDTILPKSLQDTYCTLNANAPDRGRRIADCSIYVALLLDPWQQGQYGPSMAEESFKADRGSDNDLRVAQIRAQAFTTAELGAPLTARPLGWFKADEVDTKTMVGQWNMVRGYVGLYAPGAYSDWSGGNAADRFSLAIGANFASFLVMIFMVATSVMTLVWEAALIGLMITLPMAGLVAVYPPMQKLGRAWAQTWLKAVILVAAFQVMQTLALLLVTAVLNMKSTPLGVKAFLIIILMSALWKLVKMVREDALTPNLGGGEMTAHFDADQKIKQAKETMGKVAKSTVGRAVGGALLASGAGAIAAGVATRAFNKEGEAAREGAVDEETQRRVTAEQERYAVENNGAQMSEEDHAAMVARTRAEVDAETPAAQRMGARDAARATAKGAFEGAVAGASNRYGNPLVLGAKAGAKGAKGDARDKAKDRVDTAAAEARYTQERTAYQAELDDYNQWVAAGSPSRWGSEAAPAGWRGGPPRPPAAPPSRTSTERFTPEQAAQYGGSGYTVDPAARQARADQQRADATAGQPAARQAAAEANTAAARADRARTAAEAAVVKAGAREKELGDARRAVEAARRSGDVAKYRAAQGRVQQAEQALADANERADRAQRLWARLDRQAYS